MPKPQTRSTTDGLFRIGSAVVAGATSHSGPAYRAHRHSRHRPFFSGARRGHRGSLHAARSRAPAAEQPSRHRPLRVLARLCVSRWVLRPRFLRTSVPAEHELRQRILGGAATGVRSASCPPRRSQGGERTTWQGRLAPKISLLERRRRRGIMLPRVPGPSVTVGRAAGGLIELRYRPRAHVEIEVDTLAARFVAALRHCPATCSTWTRRRPPRIVVSIRDHAVDQDQNRGTGCRVSGGDSLGRH